MHQLVLLQHVLQDVGGGGPAEGGVPVVPLGHVERGGEDLERVAVDVHELGAGEDLAEEREPRRVHRALQQQPASGPGPELQLSAETLERRQPPRPVGGGTAVGRLHGGTGTPPPPSPSDILISLGPGSGVG